MKTNHPVMSSIAIILLIEATSFSQQWQRPWPACCALEQIHLAP